MSDRLESLGKYFRSQVRAHAVAVEPNSNGFRGHLMDSAAFSASEFKLSWLVNNILVEKQPCVVGGAKKALKTSIIVDLGISIASGQRFLGRFLPAKPKRVAIFSGESGGATLKETAHRICDAKHIELAHLPMFWSFELPQLGDRRHLETVSKSIRDNGIEVVFLDPLYLCLLSAGSDLQASNLYHIGPLLKSAADACLSAGATPVLIHHFKLNSGASDQPPELRELAYAGIQEFARQWILLGRRSRYEEGTGHHDLWLVAGGSAGFSSCWAVNVEEGVCDENFRGRRWDVRIRSKKDEFECQQNEKRQKAQKTKERRDLEIKDLMLKWLRSHPEGETKSQLSENAHVSHAIGKGILEQLIADKKVEECKVIRGSKPCDGYRLFSQNGTDQAD